LNGGMIDKILTVFSYRRIVDNFLNVKSGLRWRGDQQ